MSASLAAHQVHVPRTLRDALEHLHDHHEETWRPLAGGTDLMVGLYRNQTADRHWLDLSRLRAELAGISRDGDLIRIGALTTMAELRTSALLAATCPLVPQAAGWVGAPQVQNRATVGGNIVNNSPAGDTLPVWLAHDAELELSSSRGVRRLAHREFMTGYRSTALAPDELLTAILLRPRWGATTRQYFRKLAPRAAQGISKVVFAGLVTLDDGRLREVRLALGSVGPTALLATAAEQMADGQDVTPELAAAAARELERDLAPVDDHRSTADYRRRAAANLVREFLAGNLGTRHVVPARS